GTADGHKGPAAERDHLLHRGHRRRRAEAGIEERDAAALAFGLVDGTAAVDAEVGALPGTGPGDDLLEEAHHRDVGQVGDRLPELAEVDDAGLVQVGLEQGRGHAPYVYATIPYPPRRLAVISHRGELGP